MSSTQATMEKLLSRLRTAPESDFYRTLWGKNLRFSELPTVAREDFLRVPLSKRRYKNERALVKIVHEGGRAFLSEWSFADIGREPFGLLSKRPTVYLSDPHEAIEKSMWCYENGMVPLIGEKDPDIAMFAAGKYQVDSLITDAVALEKFKPYFQTHERISSISILGTSFDIPQLMQYAAYAETIRLVLALPEVGAFAHAALGPDIRFAPLPGCIIERDTTLIISKDSLLVTPIVRYRTTIPTSLYDGA